MLCRAGNPKSQRGLQGTRPSPSAPSKAPDLPQPGEGTEGAAKGSAPGSDARGALWGAELGGGHLPPLLSDGSGEALGGPTVVCLPHSAQAALWRGRAGSPSA